MPQSPKKYRAFGRSDLDRLPQFAELPVEERHALKAVSAVLPFKLNNYVLEELIDWSRIPHDPIYQLTVPQREMLAPADFARMVELVRRDAPAAELRSAASEIRARLNPHPAGQKTLNVPHLDGEPLPGMQHKYRETVLFFPASGQTCHAYCTYCFRWAQFVGDQDLRFAARETAGLVRYLRSHPEVSSVLITGGDPMIMRPEVLRAYLEPLLAVETVRSIRIGTKSLAYWPYAYTTDDSAGAYLRLFEEIVASGRTLAFMAHFSHPVELETAAVENATAAILSTGAVIRCQAPLIRHVNDAAGVWARMWRTQVRLGMVPYYMFVERDTGPKRYFEVPLARALEIFRGAYQQVSGLARTVRGPSLSATPGKVELTGVTEINGRRVFALQFLQARNPDWVKRPFFAEYDETATWLDDLVPAFGDREFFYETELRDLSAGAAPPRATGRPVANAQSPRFRHGTVGHTGAGPAPSPIERPAPRR
ncbi:MAG: KamA family radical SAM protein [Planctomycetota bacterium]|jgi:L-lysine 2,3-aminomutase